MEIKLTKEIKKPLIIEGFPGFGLIGAITTEFLLNHLETELVGSLCTEEMPATVAVHDGTVLMPVGIYYNEKYNLLIVHSITPPTGLEWKLGKAIIDLAEKTDAWEIICLEGVGSMKELSKEDTRTYFYSNMDESKKKLKDFGLQELKEGIIIGVTSSLMVYGKDRNFTALFAEAHSQLPDSKASARIIEILDQYLGLNVDPKPLLESAEQFEKKIKGILDQSQKATQQKDAKMMDYVG